MKSPAEIQFRLRQEMANLVLLLFPPKLDLDAASPLAGLPDPDLVAESLKGSRLEGTVCAAAEEILAGRYRLLGFELDLGRDLRWRNDPVHHRETGLDYFRRIPYLDAEQTGDHKIIWELSRHQHLTTLAQAFVLSRKPELLDELVRQWEHWVLENPFQRGINWTSALEVAFRALSWIWIYHLVGRFLEPSLRRRMLRQLYLHGLHLEYNLSIYFSPNTHLLGEAVALHALGVLFPRYPRAQKWRHLGAQVVREELTRQVRADGSHFEKSTYYHVYALDFFLFHYVLSGRPRGLRPVLEAMTGYLDGVMGPQRRMPWIGDDDGGRLFFPVGPKAEYGRATLATCAILFDHPEWLPDPADAEEQATWWLGSTHLRMVRRAVPAARSRIFSDSGTVILAAGEFWILMNTGNLGPFRAGHSHSHALALVARYGSEDILIDPGTYTYLGNSPWRDRFRGSAAHNTVRVNGHNQAVPEGPFAWSRKASVRLVYWRFDSDEDELVAVCSYVGSEIQHCRRILFRKPQTLFVLDEINGPLDATVEQYWHAGSATLSLSPRSFRIGERITLATCADAQLIRGEEIGWRSEGYGSKEPSPVVVVPQSAATPIFLGAVLHVSEMQTASIELSIIRESSRVGLKCAGGASCEAFFKVGEDLAPKDFL